MSGKSENLPQKERKMMADEEEMEKQEDRDNNRKKETKRKRGRRKINNDKQKEKAKSEIERLKKWSEEIGERKGVKELKEKENDLRMKADDVKLQWFGDEIEEDDGWPKETKHGCIRILHQNINGTSPKNEYIDWEMKLNNLNDLQVDVACLSEINLDLNNAEVKHKLIEKAKYMDKHLKIQTAASKTTTSNSLSKRGGTMTIVRGNWAGNVKKVEKDKLGRWTTVEMIGKKGKTVKIVTAYRVCDQKHAQGNCTIYLQQQNDLIQANRENTDPRNAILEDLGKMIEKDHRDGKIVILTCDMNESVQRSRKLDRFLNQNNMYNAIEEIHRGLYPATYDRGRECLDLIAISNTVERKAIKKSGYLPFYEGYVSDHRALYVDIDAKELFTYAKPNTNLEIYKRFTTEKVAKCEKYVKGLEKYILESKIDTKVAILKREMEEYMVNRVGDIDNMIKRSKILFEKVTQLMIASEKKVGRKHYSTGYPSSRKLKEAGDRVFHANKMLRYESTRKIKDQSEIYKCVKEKRKSKQMLKEVQMNASKEREQDLLLLAEKRAEEWNLPAAKAIIVIKESEASKKIHRKQKIHLKPKQGGSIQKILVPAPVQGITPKESHITDSRTQCWVEDPQDVFNILLRQNFRSLLKSENSIFSKGEVINEMDRDNESRERVITEIINGVFDVSDMNEAKTNFGDSLERFMNSMKRVTLKNGSTVEDFKWKFGKNEYRETFKKTKEATSCGPSGLHMSHWKAALQSEMLMEIHSFFIWAAFEFGYTYNRWEQSWHCMLEKKAKPYSQKLRIIQLFEGDLNGGLKYILGRVLMWHIHEKGIMDDEIYGSRVGKTGAEALISLQLIADYARTWKLNLAVLYNDADGCFDRVPPTLAEIALRRIGCPASIAKTHTEVQQRMKHYVKTAVGISEGYIIYSKVMKMILKQGILLLITGLIGGIGQGGGSSPIIWMAVIMAMMMAYKTTQSGADMYDPVTKERTTFWLTSYVDDNTLVKYFHRKSSLEEILDSMTKSLNEWLNLLRITGGDLSLTKCKITIMKWKKQGWRNQMVLESAKQSPGTVHLKNNTTGEMESLERIEPWEAERILGLRLPLTGSMQNELKYRKDKLEKFGERFYKAPLSNYDAQIAFQSRYRPMATYPLPVTTFLTSELAEMQKKCVHAMLPKMGLNRHTPRTVIYGPKQLGGLQLLDLRVEQPTLHLEATIGHLRRGQKIGKTLTIALRNLQIEVGTGKPFYELNPDDHQYITPNTRWKYFWQAIFEHGIRVKMYNFWTPKPNCPNDRNIMEVAVNDPKLQRKGNRQLESINKCRMYLQVFYIGDMENEQGKLNKNYLCGKARYRHPEVIIPLLEYPTEVEWKEWKDFIFRNFLIGAYNIHPPLQQKVCIEKFNDEKSEAQNVIQIVTSEKRLSQIMKELPDNISPIMGTINIPQDDGRDLAAAIESGSVIGASDGSLHQDNKYHSGGHAFSLQRWETNENRVVGYGKTPTSSNMSSTTTEYYGMIAVVVLVLILETKYNITVEQSHPPIQIYCNNEEVINKANCDEPTLNISEANKLDYDLYKLLHSFIKCTTVPLCFKWIKGHQNVNKEGDRIYGPFTRPTQLNIEMDEYAGRASRERQNEIMVRQPYSTSNINLYTEEGLLIQDIRHHITVYTSGKQLKEYLLKKNMWGETVFNKIAWTGLERAIKTYKPQKQTRIVQLMHNWQWVGERKKMMDANDKGICPACGKDEGKLHYLTCQHRTLKEQRNNLLRLLGKQLAAAETFPGIISSFTKILTYGFEPNWIATMRTETRIEAELIKAIKIQQQIGDDTLPKGFLATHWEQVQKLWMKQTNCKNYSYDWAKEAISALHTYTYGTWKLHNVFEHGKTEFSSRAQEREKLQNKIEALYNKPRHHLDKRELRHFKLPKEQRKNKSMEAMALWTMIVEGIFKRKQSKLNETLDTWLTGSTPAQNWKDKYKDSDRNDSNNIIDTD